MSDKDWVKLAMNDDSVVVELLMGLHHAARTKRENSPSFSLEWSVRQRRSKPMILPKKKPTPTSSPTTPLSWSGANSLSGGGCAGAGVAPDGFEESSRSPPKRPVSTRSEVITASGTATNKRSRKKKALPELKEEEIMLLKERRNLKRALAALRVTLEKHKATNDSLKKLRLDLESRQAAAAAERVTEIASLEEIPHERQQKLPSCDLVPSVLQPDVTNDDHDDARQLLSPNCSSKLQQEVINQENKLLLLPDLNIPIENSNSEVIDGVS